MIDNPSIRRRMLALEEYVTDLELVRKEKSREVFNSDKVLRRYVERTLHLAVEACLDIANSIISFEGFREPTSNRDSFLVLCEQGILPQHLSDQMMKMAQFRNVIVHDYLKIQPEIVFGILESNVSDLVAFAQRIRGKYFDN